jgi:hypothetical protein
MSAQPINKRVGVHQRGKCRRNPSSHWPPSAAAAAVTALCLSQVAEFQESSLPRRKALAAQARAYTMLLSASSASSDGGDDSAGDSTGGGGAVPADVRERGSELIKAFKGEVDALTKRTRHSEAAFLALYKLLREAPDPALLVRARGGGSSGGDGSVAHACSRDTPAACSLCGVASCALERHEPCSACGH